MRGIPWLAEDLLTSQGLCSMALVVSYLVMRMKMWTRDLPRRKHECYRLELGLSRLCTRRPEDRVRFPAWAGSFLFVTPLLRSSLGPTKPPIQRILGNFSLGVKRPEHEVTTYLQQVPKGKKYWNISVVISSLACKWMVPNINKQH
jgi:hypothetical protein